jgi:EAL domain-containing protein (putative c-di-GMP-specific phosphodiesterase class I)
MPLAEESGLILAISQWVLETACTQLEAWSRNESTRDLMLSVNVSARQFRQPEFVDQIKSALDNSSANPKRLKLEMSERLVLDDVAQSVQKMQALKQWGVQFSMDNFGTGFSSLSYLTLLPLNELKIDRSYVFKLPGHETYAAIVTTIIIMARSLGLTVVAEGVENEAQRAFLDSRGCHAFQGYLFSRPLSLEDFEVLVGQT